MPNDEAAEIRPGVPLDYLRQLAEHFPGYEAPGLLVADVREFFPRYR